MSDTPNLDGLGYANQQPARAVPKGKTRLEEKVDEKKLTVVTEREFKAAVWRRDSNRCRCCGRKVQKTISLVPERGEVHHIHGRAGDLRFESRGALLLCATDHQRVTGRVNDHRLVIVGTRFFTLQHPPGKYINADHLVRFQEWK